jgi:hypothetical protein
MAVAFVLVYVWHVAVMLCETVDLQAWSSSFCPGRKPPFFSMVKRGLVTFCNSKCIMDQTGGGTRGRNCRFERLSALVWARHLKPIYY